MPNHITSRLEMQGSKEAIREVLQKFSTHYPAELRRAHDGNIICKLKGPETFQVGWFDEKTGKFSRRDEPTLIGLPEEWEFEIQQPTDHFPDFAKVIPPPDDPAYRDEPSQDVAKTSPNWWYDWNRDNWGTKWNSYSNHNEDGVYFWDTAWSGVPDLIQEMSSQCPEVEFHYKYADEDAGNNVGNMVFKNGEIIEQAAPIDQSVEAWNIYFDTHPGNQENYKFNGTTYEYKED